MRSSFLFIIALLIATLVPVDRARAEPLNYHQVALNAEASREIDNDLLTATLFVEQSDQDPARLADQVNRKLNAALALGKNYKTVTLRSGNRVTYPLYVKNRSDGWRTRAELVLESRDFVAAGKLIGELQGQLQLTGVHFAVSSEARAKAQNELIGEAIAAFRTRADLAAKGFGATSWKLVQTSIGTDDLQPMPMYKGMLAAARMDAAGEVATPEMAAGASRLRVVVSGSIELQP
jgi:predicted secreted protein